MRDLRLVATITIGLALAAIGGCGEKDEAPPAAATTTSAEEPAADAPPDQATDERERGAVLEQSDVPEPGEDAAGPDLSRAERLAVATANRYVAELQNRDGAAVCRLLAPGALGAVKLPRERGGCGPSLEASIGYRDPRGMPVWESAEIEAIASLDVSGKEATVIPTVFTRFADRAEPSVEDDPIYLLRAPGGGWEVAQPSLTLYRAVGQEPPPQALTPP